MKCDKVEQLLPFLQDGSLEESTAREVERHLERCSGCAKAYSGLSAVVSLAGYALRARTAPADAKYVSEVRERIGKRAHARSVFRLVVPAAAAMFLFVSVGTYTLFLDGGVKYRSAHTSTVRTAQPASSSQAATADENTRINAMYHYSDVTLDDFVSRMDASELAAALEAGER